jgi:hypothetical protein
LSPLIWPCLLLGLAAVGIAAGRVYELTWRAPVAAAPLTTALVSQIAAGDMARARALCDALRRCWAADCAAECLRSSEQLPAVIEDLRSMYGQRAKSGLGALHALGRIAFPLALGTAVVSMSGAFADADVARVEAALGTALQSMTLAVATTVFCRVSATVVSRQGEARLREVAAVCRGMQDALAAPTRA